MLETLFSQFDNLLVLDTETTGINCRTDEIIELAVLRLTQEGGTLRREEMDEFIRLSPGRRLPAMISCRLPSRSSRRKKPQRRRPRLTPPSSAG